MEWSEEALSAAEIPAIEYAELHASTDVIGNLTAHAAEELGLAVNHELEKSVLTYLAESSLLSEEEIIRDLPRNQILSLWKLLQ